MFSLGYKRLKKIKFSINIHFQLGQLQANLPGVLLPTVQEYQVAVFHLQGTDLQQAVRKRQASHGRVQVSGILRSVQHSIHASYSSFGNNEIIAFQALLSNITQMIYLQTT